MKLLLIIIGVFNGFISSKTISTIHSLTFPKKYYLWRNFWKVIISSVLTCCAVGALFVWPVYVFSRDTFPKIVIGDLNINGYTFSIMIGALIWRILVDKKILYE